jgi:lysophospholipase L1-like esterase
MTQLILYISLALYWALALPDKQHIRIFLAGDSTMSIKETRAYPETGWGMPFVFFWNEKVQVVNEARNGRSTKTFINEGLWKKITDHMQEGDYVLIQFGHNDESVEKKERYTTPDSFALNLERFVQDARNRKAHPVLLTPVARRKFDKEGQVQETHAAYAPIVQQVAAKWQVPCIDLNKLSMELYASMGEENSKWFFLHLKPGEHPNYPEGKTDNTHFSELGARIIAQRVLEELRVQVPELNHYIVQPKK